MNWGFESETSLKHEGYISWEGRQRRWLVEEEGCLWGIVNIVLIEHVGVSPL